MSLTLLMSASLRLAPFATDAEVASQPLQRCELGSAHKVAARCGDVRVYENRQAARGRTIGLHVIVVAARHPTGRAIFWNPGGPGQADADDVPFIVDGLFERELETLNDTYDLVFVDNRGTSGANALKCDLYDPAHPAAYFADLFPPAALRACRAAEANVADLDSYTTDATADDIDDVRERLGYRKIVLDGGSYGTMLYLDYARRHPAHVESLVLQGVAPPGFVFVPLEDAQGARTAMADLTRDCEQDELCSSNFPNFAEHFAELVRRLDRGPIRMSLQRGPKKPHYAVSLSKEVFADQVRHVLYSNDGAKYVPYIVEQSHLGNDAPLATLIDAATLGIGGGLAMGLNLSITCAEDVPYVSEAQIERSSAGSFQGDTRMRSQQRACRTWNVAQVPASFVRPVRSDAPVLMISGASDPATPPVYGREALRYLPNGRQIVIPHATHETESACTDALIVTFVHTRDAGKLDGSKCAATSHRPPFATSLRGFGS